MASEIRAILGAAQAAEVKGHSAEAARLLREAAAFYRDRQLITRAMQMLRHARRLEGHPDPGPPLDGFSPRELTGDDDFDGPTGEYDWSEKADQAEADRDAVFGFGDELQPGGVLKMQSFDRTIALADPALDAWCSFCCRPTVEVGALTAGPTGSYICRGCTERARALLDGETPPTQAPNEIEKPASPSVALLAAQQSALTHYLRRSPKLALVIGPEGVGKSVVASAIRERARRVTVIEAPVRDDAVPTTGYAVIVVRGDPPAPALTLDGPNGPEPVFDTDALVSAAAGQISKAVLAKVDAVFALPALDSAALRELATVLLTARQISLPAATIDTLVGLAEKSGRASHELVSLVARIPPGQYQRP